MSASDVLVIGAGPYGLSISSQLRGLGVDHMVVGRPMDTWRAHMPEGMCLKSEPYGSVFAAPRHGYDIASYCKAHDFDYVDRLGPLTLERFLGYADWFTEQLVPDVQDVTVTKVTATADCFRVEFADSAPVTVRQVVLATGLQPYAYLPGELAGLPSDLLTHTIDHHLLGKFAGRRVVVVGAGQSALETAALLHEAGADVQIVARVPQILWADPTPAELGLVDYIKRPPTKLCEGWRCAFWNTPMAFQRLPKDMRARKARSVLGPMGSWWLRDRVDGVIETLTSHRIRQVASSGSSVRLLFDGPNQSSIEADHVVAGTGFRVDLTRLSFLSEELQGRIATYSSYPVVNRAGESTVPGLYFAGAHTAVSLGPSVRFVAGTHNVAAVVARSVARRARTGKGRPVAAVAEPTRPMKDAAAAHRG